jgi:transglutaminase-like putative cysteine protease
MGARLGTSDEIDMARRFGRFVGLAALVLVYLRLFRVLSSDPTSADWRLIAPAAALGGAVVTVISTRLGAIGQALLHVVGLILVMLRVVVPETLIWGLIPGPETLSLAAERLGFAFEVLRFGAPPVAAVAGITALVAAAMWLLGAAWATSVVGGGLGVSLVPSLGFYLYLALVDRSADSTPWNFVFVVIAALSLVATSDVVPAGAGRVRAVDHRPIPRWESGPALAVAAVLVVVAVAGTVALTPLLPANGAIQWRNPGGLGTGGGEGLSASLFVDLRQRVLSLSEEPVFLAQVNGPAPAGPAGYWRQRTLSHFDGTTWTGRTVEEIGTEGVPQELSTVSVVQRVTIGSLRTVHLPTLYAPVGDVQADPQSEGFSLHDDGTLKIDPLSPGSLTYQIESQVPVLEPAALRASSGVDSAPVSDIYLDLPEIDPEILALARRQTAGAATELEAALLLEDFFLSGFEYSAEVSTGHSALDLAAWLLDDESPNYRTGYCEQFALAMAVMGRLLGIPTRVVVGFTGGERTPTEGGYRTEVLERNSHAWVEAWIDGQWVGLDPTPRSITSPLTEVEGFEPPEAPEADVGEDPLEQPGFDDLAPNLPIEDLVSTPANSGGSFPIWIPVVGLVGLLVATIPFTKAIRRRRRRRLAASGDVTAAWEEIVDRLSDLGSGPAPDRTPVEFAGETSPDLLPLAYAYSAAVYGDRAAVDSSRHLASAEQWLERNFDRSHRARGALNPRSLLKR